MGKPRKFVYLLALLALLISGIGADSCKGKSVVCETPSGRSYSRIGTCTCRSGDTGVEWFGCD